VALVQSGCAGLIESFAKGKTTVIFVFSLAKMQCFFMMFCVWQNSKRSIEEKRPFCRK
jgi:hypothetical protein